MIRTLTRAALLALAALSTAAGAGCVDINGGAVELRWEVRLLNGEKTFCSDTQIARVELCATPAQGAEMTRCGSWPCGYYYGSTEFDIPPGRYSLEIHPLCSDGSIPAASVPAPIVRDIQDGDVAQLDTLLIVKTSEGFVCPVP